MRNRTNGKRRRVVENLISFCTLARASADLTGIRLQVLSEWFLLFQFIAQFILSIKCVKSTKIFSWTPLTIRAL